MTSLAARIAGFPKAQPFVFNLGVAAAKTSAADMMTQTVVEKKSFPNGIDWKRNASFTVFGFAYLGGFQYWLQVNMFRKMFVGMDKVAEMPLSDLASRRESAFTPSTRVVPGMMDVGGLFFDFEMLSRNCGPFGSLVSSRSR